ncbi:MAG: pyruvate formate-lyase [Clostridia bacterium]|nr:pyruvate formate-lyase [Clostridia bacterium]
MTNQPLYDFIISHAHHVWRRPSIPSRAAEYASAGLTPAERMSARFCEMAAEEAKNPHILPGQKIVLMRTLPNGPDVLTAEEWESIRQKHFIHESGYISNICPDHMSLVRTGFRAAREGADPLAIADLDALSALCESYRQEAIRTGRTDVADVLSRVPEYPAATFREALQFFRIVHYGLWMEGDYHNTVGRFDVYMMPYLRQDLDAGILTTDEARELLEDFFLSFNIDSDMYTGIQQGDNGQSMMLGGRLPDGGTVWNDLTEMCLEVSGELKLIDPKINLRVDRNTPLSVYEKGTELTRVGLGFPQYSNDDVVIPALIRLGYAPEDAADYTVAACWEFIIPKEGMEIANIGALSYPLCVDRAIRTLDDSATMQDLKIAVAGEIRRETASIMDTVHDVWFVPSPFLNLLYGGRNIADGAKYNNFGMHGTGISCGADSLAALDKYVFTEKRWPLSRVIAALDKNFEGEDEMCAALRYEAPKCGKDPEADQYLVYLTEAFSCSLAGRKNCRGGIWRAGTGSAMFYLWHAAALPASPDGRRQDEPFAANYSVSIFAKIASPVDVVKSFTKPDLTKVCNGGPLTLEFHDKMFAGEDAVSKIASLVRYFILSGGHQLQLNAVNRDRLLDAQANPDKYRQLIVRIWGWSAYFCELDREFQDHVIRRQEYVI